MLNLMNIRLLKLQILGNIGRKNNDYHKNQIKKQFLYFLGFIHPFSLWALIKRIQTALKKDIVKNYSYYESLYNFYT